MKYHVAMAVGGTILFVAVIMIVYIIFALLKTPKVNVNSRLPRLMNMRKLHHRFLSVGVFGSVLRLC